MTFTVVQDVLWSLGPVCPLGLSEVEAAPTNYKCRQQVASILYGKNRGCRDRLLCKRPEQRHGASHEHTCSYAFSNSLALALSSHTDLTSSWLCLFCRVRNTIRIPHLLYFQHCLPSSLSLHTCAPLHMACPQSCSTPPSPLPV